MATKEHLDVKKSFNWLRREARGPTYISYSEISDRLACSFEFGENGCAASCNYGGELLHMSAKDDEKGIIFAHGDFESTYYSSLARAQRQHGGQATFGLGIAANQEPYHTADDPMDRGSNVTIGPMMERGSFNYRWPFNEYVLRLNEKDSSNPKETGTCARVSFVKDDILYQVIRLEKGCRLEADVCHYVPWRGQVVLSVGGLIKFSAFGTDNACAGVEEYGVPELSSQSILGSTTQLDIRVRQLNGDEYDTLDLNLPGDKNQRPDKQGGQYYACAELPERKDIMSQEGKQAIFVAEFRLRNAGPQPQWPETPTSEQIYAHLGIDSYSKMATGVMWETIFLQREERTGYFSESSEVNLIGRSVEKILTVDLVPTAFGGQGDTFEETSPLALVSNLFLRPSVDLESLFWKVRFLAKAYRFLSSFKLLTSPDTYLKPSFNDSSDEMDMAYLQSTAPSISRTEHHRYGTKSAWNKIEVMMNAVNFQMERLQEAIERILSYLVRAFIQPETQSNSMSLVTRAFQSNYYYVMITIWYIVKKCERFGFTWKWADGMKTWPTGSCLLENCIPPDNLLPEDKEKEKVTFLKWYHYASVLNLMARKKPLLPKVWQTKNLDMKVNLLERDARRAAAAKLSSSQPYSAEDEILDRLGFLAEALHAEYSKGRAGSVASITVRRILGRDSTRRLNPGRLPSGEKGQVSGPWEIHALCHHSRLLVENYQYNKEGDRTREQKAEDAERYRGMISQFLNAEACLVPCWERTNMASFQSEATSVLASTLLGICQKDFILTLGPNEGGELASRQGDAKSVPPPPSPRLKTDFSYPFPQTPGPKLNSREYPTERLSIKPQTTDMKRPRAIEWLRYRPPRQYHHASFFNSLDDTPQLFTISNVDERTSALLSSLPNINGEPYSQMEFDMMSINRMLEGHQMSIIDLKASVPDQWNSHTWKGYRSELSTLDKYDSSRANEGTRRADLQKLEKMLSDSLVDQEVQHRTIILSGSFKEILDRRLLGFFCCVFHVGSMDCFINHVLRFPDFSCQKGNNWVTRITLRSWSKSTITPSDYDKMTKQGLLLNGMERISESASNIGYQDGSHYAEQSEEDALILLPPSLKDSLRFINERAFDEERQSPGIVELKVSSIILSTNGFGDFSQCTIISELLDGKSRERLGEECKDLWEKFIHQPQTARCLVFLSILGHLCQKIAAEYQEAMVYFIRTPKIDKSSIFNENSLLKGPHSLTQLQLGLWSLESLFKLHNSLENSRRCIEEASLELRSQINHGSAQRSETLDRMCQNSLETFERKLGKLVVLNAELDQKIRLNSRYKDSLSTVLSLEDSRNSIRQNNTIQKLTYLTICYLPLGLITGIFAIPSEQNVLIPSMGLGAYFICIFGLFFITFMVAVFMEQLLHGLGKLTTLLKPPAGGSGSSGLLQPQWSRYLRASHKPPSMSEDLEQGKEIDTEGNSTSS